MRRRVASAGPEWILPAPSGSASARLDWLWSTDVPGPRVPSQLARYPAFHPRRLFRRDAVKDDAMAGLVLGVESVPDGLASGLLAGVNPVYGLYGYLYGMVGGALFTSTTFMTVQATGAMSIIVADVDLAARDDPGRALFTLAMVTGAVMIAAGLLRLGSFLRFVSNSVMTGFITAVGINIVLGQLGDFTGYDAEGGNRVARALNLVFNFWKVDAPTILVGAVTIVLIVVLQRTRLGALGLVVAVVAGSALAAALREFDRDISILGDIADVPNALPMISAPVISDIPGLLVPAASLAFVGLVQGRACPPGSRTRTALPPTCPRTSSARVPATSSPACSRGCRSADRCRRARSSRPRACGRVRRCCSPPSRWRW